MMWDVMATGQDICLADGAKENILKHESQQLLSVLLFKKKCFS